MTGAVVACTAILCFITAAAAGPPPRSSAVRRAFLAQHGLTHTPAGCQVDHIVPLMCGGPDALSNLQLLCGAALREKERTERTCRPQERRDHGR